MDIGALEIFYEGKHVHYKINLFIFSFFRSTFNVSLIQKSNNILDFRIVTRRRSGRRKFP